MDRDINEYVTIIRQKNGKLKITHNVNNEANIYKLLFSLGFRKSKLGNKRIFFQKQENDLVPVHIHNINSAFFDILKNSEFKNLPKDIDYNDILNWYLEKQPIKQNGLFDHFLNVELNEKEKEILKLKTDTKYRHKNEIIFMLNSLKEWNFNKSIDEKSTICTNAPLYYKNIGTNNYLIFSYYNSNSKNNHDGFDCYVAKYKNERQIGKAIPIEIKTLRLSFKLKRDYQLIKEYVD